MLVKQEVIDALGHTEVVDKGYDPTCTTSGLTDGKHCSVCDEVLVKQEVISAKGHTEVVDKGYGATCTDAGLTDGKHCSVCDEVLVKQEVIKAKGHTIGVIPAKAPTCSQVGLTQGRGCLNCDLRTIPQIEIAKKKHTSKVVGKKASTYTSKGYSGDTVCADCGKLIKKGKATALKLLSAPKNLKLTKSGNKLTVKYAKVKSAKGYQISIKIGGKWKNFTTKNLKYIKKLTKGKKYQVKVRAYVVENGKKVFGSYSSVKKIKL